MYVCLCNSIKDKDMASAVAKGAQCASEVYKHHGCKPQCGKCVPFVREALPAMAASLESPRA
ncbi:MAG: (2Fe-2S)-binding protein [Rickettsiales bacterium]